MPRTQNSLSDPAIQQTVSPSDDISRVLIVDDESTSRTILKEVVTGLDSNVVAKAFESPLKALAWASEHAADLVIVDFHMPEMDGIAFVNSLRGLVDYAHVPMMMVTV